MSKIDTFLRGSNEILDLDSLGYEVLTPRYILWIKRLQDIVKIIDVWLPDAEHVIYILPPNMIGKEADIYNFVFSFINEYFSD